MEVVEHLNGTFSFGVENVRREQTECGSIIPGRSQRCLLLSLAHELLALKGPVCRVKREELASLLDRTIVRATPKADGTMFGPDEPLGVEIIEAVVKAEKRAVIVYNAQLPLGHRAISYSTPECAGKPLYLHLANRHFRALTLVSV